MAGVKGVVGEVEGVVMLLLLLLLGGKRGRGMKGIRAHPLDLMEGEEGKKRRTQSQS